MILIIFAFLISSTTGRYDANWKSLDSRPLPDWYDEGKIGIFLHWGVFSVPAFGSEWFWYNWQAAKSPAYLAYMKENYRPDFTYADFAPMFHAEFYNPLEWADIFQASGASYVVLVTKHHEGFTNWPSNHSFNWNAMDVGPKRDLVGDLANSIRYKSDLKFGVYHSMFEWFNPLYLQDQANNFKTQDFTRTKALPELYELVNNYLPDIIWSDGAWLAPDTYWNATEFLAWLYNDSPVKDTVVVNDRWGSNTPCQHGGFWNCDDKYTPGKLVGHKWEKCMTLDKYSWGYRANAKVADILTIEELLADVVRTISLGGNILINAGPTSSGKISPIYEERFRQLGSWLKVNGEAIYKSSIWTYQNDSITPDVWCPFFELDGTSVQPKISHSILFSGTKSRHLLVDSSEPYTSRTDGPQPVIYAIFLSWPKTSSLILGHPLVSSSTKISLVGYTGQLSFSPLASGGVEVVVPAIPASQMPCNWAWVLRMENLKNRQTKIKWDAYSRNVQPISMRKDLP